MKSFYMKQPYADEQVQAIIEGRKTLLVNPFSEKEILELQVAIKLGEISDFVGSGNLGVNDEPYFLDFCKYKVGDRCRLRESCKVSGWLDTGQPIVEYRADSKTNIIGDWDDSLDWYIEELWESLSDPKNYSIDGKAAERKWRPSTSMPSWASRFIMEVTRVYVRRITDITNDECVSCGISLDAENKRKEFYETSGYKDFWSKAAWCWFVEFKKV